jgi:hypothetical protein
MFWTRHYKNSIKAKLFTRRTKKEIQCKWHGIMSTSEKSWRLTKNLNKQKKTIKPV